MLYFATSDGIWQIDAEDVGGFSGGICGIFLRFSLALQFLHNVTLGGGTGAGGGGGCCIGICGTTSGGC